MKTNKLCWLMAIVAIVGCTNKQKEVPKETTTLSGLKRSNFQTIVDGDDHLANSISIVNREFFIG
jgi:aldose 1-epimerase